MVDYTLARIEGGGSSAVSPQRPVVDESSIGLMDSLAGAIKGVGSLFQERNERTVEEATNRVAADFVQRQLALADAVETGGMKSSRARMEMRKNYTAFLAENPGMIDTLTSIHKKVIDESGLGKVIMEGSEQEQLEETAWKAALKDGFGTINDDEYTRLQTIEAHRQWVEGQRELRDLKAQQDADNAVLDRDIKKLTIAGKKITNQTAALNLQTKQQENKARQAITKMFDGDFARYQRTSDEVLQRVEQGELTPEQGVVEIRRLTQEREQILRSVGAFAGTDLINNFNSIYKRAEELALDRVSGKISVETYNNQIERNILTQKALITGDEDTARLVATSDLFKIADVQLYPAISSVIQDIMVQNSDPNVKAPYNLIDNPEKGRQYLGVLRDTVGKLNNNTEGVTPKAVEEFRTNLTKVLDGVNTYQHYVDNPKELKPIIEFLADPGIGKFFESQEGFDPRFAENAKQVFQVQYEQQVIPAIKEFLDRYSDQVQPVFEGAGISFQPRSDVMARLEADRQAGVRRAAEVGDRIPIGPSGQVEALRGMREARERAEEANRKIAPLLNEMVRVTAHLGHTRNYKGVYQSVYEPQLFGREPDLTDVESATE